MQKLIPYTAALFLFATSCSREIKPVSPPPTPKAKPSVSFTFDDGSVSDMPGYKLEEWNSLLLGYLEKNKLKAVLFVKGSVLSSEKGHYILQSWNDAGHRIANHTWSHPNCGNPRMEAEQFRTELLRTDSLIRPYSGFYPFFRFPFLKEGKTPEQVETFRNILKENGYRNGYVSIDASDWYVDSRLVKRLKENPGADIRAYRKYYVEHLWNRALFYDSLSVNLHGRHVNHVLLLHHNLAAALFLGDLIEQFREKGWEVMDAEKAFDDPQYLIMPPASAAGESYFWSEAKASGKYDAVLRYPAEDGEYEKARMDSLGL